MRSSRRGAVTVRAHLPCTVHTAPESHYWTRPAAHVSGADWVMGRSAVTSLAADAGHTLPPTPVHQSVGSPVKGAAADGAMLNRHALGTTIFRAAILLSWDFFVFNELLCFPMLLSAPLTGADLPSFGRDFRSIASIRQS